MTTCILLAERLREVYLNGRWIANTNFKEQLESITWNQAIYKIENLNSIAELTYHINYYLSGLLKAFEKGKLEIHDKFSYDVTPINSHNDWNLLVVEFLDNATEFSKSIENMDESFLSKPFIDEKYGSYLRNIEGIIEHSYYHLGQIVMLKKLVLLKTVSTN